MTREEKLQLQDMVRSRDRFGPVSPEELAALPGKEQSSGSIQKMEKLCMFSKNVRIIYQSRLHCF